MSPALVLAMALADAPVVGTVPSADGVPIRYEASGQGSPAVVLIHCWTCDRRLWDHAVPMLARDHRVVTLDLAGHGESGRARKTWTIEAFGEDVKAVVEALRLDRVVLVGHSMGGLVMLEAARRLSGRVVGLVPVDILQNVEDKTPPDQVAAFLAPFRADYKAAAEGFVRKYLFVPGSPPAVIGRVVTAATGAPPAIAVACLEAADSYDAAPAFEALPVPIRAINADLFPTDRAANRRHAPQFDLVLMKGVGHYPMLEDPDRFDGLLARVVRDIAAESAAAAVLQRQTEAWNRGDLEAFCAVYDEDAAFAAPSGLVRGRAAVLERYRKRYADRAAMGTLRLDVQEARAASGSGGGRRGSGSVDRGPLAACVSRQARGLRAHIARSAAARRRPVADRAGRRVSESLAASGSARRVARDQPVASSRPTRIRSTRGCLWRRGRAMCLFFPTTPAAGLWALGPASPRLETATSRSFCSVRTGPDRRVGALSRTIDGPWGPKISSASYWLWRQHRREMLATVAGPCFA